MRHQLSADDGRFRAAFEACTLPPTEFYHRAHIRLAYTCLVDGDGDPDAALARVRTGLQTYLRHHGIDRAKYHETLTRAWVLAVRHFMDRTPPAGSADAFIDANPELLDPAIMTTHYSREVLFSREARERFVPPDIDPIPRSRGGTGST